MSPLVHLGVSIIRHYTDPDGFSDKFREKSSGSTTIIIASLAGFLRSAECYKVSALTPLCGCISVLCSSSKV